jgi:hypothetical protein
MSFRVLAAALDDLDHIDDWVTEHFGAAIAARTHAKLFAELPAGGISGTWPPASRCDRETGPVPSLRATLDHLPACESAFDPPRLSHGSGPFTRQHSAGFRC